MWIFNKCKDKQQNRMNKGSLRFQEELSLLFTSSTLFSVSFEQRGSIQSCFHEYMMVALSFCGVYGTSLVSLLQRYKMNINCQVQNDALSWDSINISICCHSSSSSLSSSPSSKSQPIYTVAGAFLFLT